MGHVRRIGLKAVVFFSLFMATVFIPGMTLTAWADDPVSYITHTLSGNTAVPSTEICETYTGLESSITNWEDGKWYVVPAGGVTIQDRITVNGTVNLILRDGTRLTANRGINVASGNTLNIYAPERRRQ